MSSKKEPSKFVGLHAHSVMSIGDAIGMPGEHVDFCLENGLDAHAITDHGNFQAFSHQYLHAKKLHKKGVNFKNIYGQEFYYVDSLTRWQKLYEEDKDKKATAKILKKNQQLDLSGDAYAETKKEMIDIAAASDGESTGTVIENEEETKSNKFKNPINQRNHLVLLAKNNQGLKSLFRLNSEAYINGFYRYPRIDLELIKAHSNNNIIGSTACIGGKLARVIFDHQTEPNWELWEPNRINFDKIQSELKNTIEGFQDALGKENFYLEIQFNSLAAQHLVNFHLIELAKATGAPLLATADSHYPRPDQWREREIYKLMAWMSMTKSDGDKDKIPKKIEELKCELYPKNAQQMWESYKRYGSKYDFYNDEVISQAIEQSWHIAHEQIDNVDIDKTVKLPVLKKIVGDTALKQLEELEKLEEGLDPEKEDDIAFKELVRLSREGFIKRRLSEKANKEEYIERVKEELDVIKTLGLQNYFLTYYKIMEICSKEMLLGTARGSAAGSLVSYLLNITQVDPVKFGLLFERFLSRKKAGMPDIDSDFSDRDRATQILRDYFGEENVIPVTNFNQLQMRSLVKDISRLNNIPFEKINEYTKNIENEARAEAKKTPGFDAAGWVLTFEEAQKHSPTFNLLINEYPDFEKTIKVLFKQMRNVSRHAGGLILTRDTKNNMPVIKSGGVLQTPWPEGLNFRHLEEFGFLKFDVLGLGTLRMFEDCIRRIIKKETGKKYVSFEEINDYYYKNVHPDNNPLDDQKVFETVYHNRTYAGIFQFVQKNVQSFASKLKPTSINDLAVVTSLFRPGPLSIKADKMFLDNRTNPENIVYKHPLLKDVLEPTSGLIVYQEQLQLIYHKLAGLPLDETDGVRKAFTKKDLSNKEASDLARKNLKDEFLTKCKTVNNIDESISSEIFEEIDKFVAYSFNKSHAISYAIISWQCAWFLTHHRDEWIATYLDYCTVSKGKASGKEDPKAVALGEVRQLGYKLAKADINVSEAEFAAKNGTIYPSFASLKHVGATVVEEIMEMRPYNKVEDLLFTEDGKWKHRKFNKRALDTLIKLEAFDSMDIVGPGKLFENYRQMHYVLVENGDLIKKTAARKSNNDWRAKMLELVKEAKDLDDWNLKEKITHSKELSGSVDMALIIPPDLTEMFDSANINSIDDWDNDFEPVWAVVASTKKAQTKTGKYYINATVYGLTGSNKKLFIWGFDPIKHSFLSSNTLILTKMKKSDFGFSCYYTGIKVLNESKVKPKTGKTSKK